jgi:NAD(P)-dependent dehydrogenase (short-subunit alcohol dehydrogenase family)
MLTARSKARASPVAEQIAAKYPSVQTSILEMDLGSLASVRTAAASIHEKIDVLINSAGMMATPYGLTADGFETQFGINHLGHFLFTNLLVKQGKIRDGGRIVNVTSDGHRLGNVRFEDPGYEVCPIVSSFPFFFTK